MSITTSGVVVAGVALAGGAEERQRRLLVAGERARVEAVALADRCGELRAVAGVAHGARQHARCAASPSWRRSARGSRRAPANTRSIASSRELPVASTPSPSRVTFERRSSSASRGRPRRRRRAGAWSSFRCRRRRRARRSSRRVGHGLARRGRRAGCRPRGRPCAARVAWVAEPMCGTTSRFGALQQRVVGGQRLGVGDVEPGAGDLRRRAARARARRWSTIGAARGVDEDRGGLHPLERGGVDQVAGLGRQRACAGRRSRRARAAPSSGVSRVWSTLHVEARRPLRDRLADAPGADDARAWRRGRRGRASRSGSQVRHVAARATSAAASGGGARRRACSAKARSAVASVRTSGVMPTGMPRARRGREVDVVGADRVVGDHAQLGRGVEQLARRPGRSASRAGPRPATCARSSLGRRGQLVGPDVDLVRRGEPVERGAGKPAGDEDAGHVRDCHGFRVPPRTGGVRRFTTGAIMLALRRGVEQSGSSSGS